MSRTKSRGRNRNVQPSRKNTSEGRDHGRKRTKRARDWIGSPLLSAMDGMDKHVQEMLDHDQQQTPPNSGSSKESPALSTVALKDQFIRELTAQVNAKVSTIIDTTILRRINRLEASRKTNQTNIDAVQAGLKLDRQVLDDLDAFHRQEHDLNSALVQRLFRVWALKGDPNARFAETAFGLQGTDSANSVLVSHVEMLVMKVQLLEERVEELQNVLVRIGAT